MKKCPICGGELEGKIVTHPQAYRGKIIILENVPAEVCRQCGEVLIRPGVLEKVQELVWSEAEPRRTTCLPVYDMAEVGVEPSRNQSKGYMQNQKQGVPVSRKIQLPAKWAELRG